MWYEEMVALMYELKLLGRYVPEALSICQFI